MPGPLEWHGCGHDQTRAGKCTSGRSGHSFFIFFGEGFYPINVLNALKNVAEVCGIYCATANPVEVIIATTEQGRAILGVVDGTPPKALEEEADIAWRKGLLRQIGYKL